MVGTPGFLPSHYDRETVLDSDLTMNAIRRHNGMPELVDPK